LREDEWWSVSGAARKQIRLVPASLTSRFQDLGLVLFRRVWRRLIYLPENLVVEKAEQMEDADLVAGGVWPNGFWKRFSTLPGAVAAEELLVQLRKARLAAARPARDRALGEAWVRRVGDVLDLGWAKVSANSLTDAASYLFVAQLWLRRAKAEVTWPPAQAQLLVAESEVDRLDRAIRTGGEGIERDGESGQWSPLSTGLISLVVGHGWLLEWLTASPLARAVLVTTVLIAVLVRVVFGPGKVSQGLVRVWTPLGRPLLWTGLRGRAPPLAGQLGARSEASSDPAQAGELSVDAAGGTPQLPTNGADDRASGGSGASQLPTGRARLAIPVASTPTYAALSGTGTAARQWLEFPRHEAGRTAPGARFGAPRASGRTWLTSFSTGARWAVAVLGVITVGLLVITLPAFAATSGGLAPHHGTPLSAAGMAAFFSMRNLLQQVKSRIGIEELADNLSSEEDIAQALSTLTDWRLVVGDSESGYELADAGRALILVPAVQVTVHDFGLAEDLHLAQVALTHKPVWDTTDGYSRRHAEATHRALVELLLRLAGGRYELSTAGAVARASRDDLLVVLGELIGKGWVTRRGALYVLEERPTQLLDMLTPARTQDTPLGRFFAQWPDWPTHSDADWAILWALMWRFLEPVTPPISSSTQGTLGAALEVLFDADGPLSLLQWANSLGGIAHSVRGQAGALAKLGLVGSKVVGGRFMVELTARGRDLVTAWRSGTAGPDITALLADWPGPSRLRAHEGPINQLLGDPRRTAPDTDGAFSRWPFTDRERDLLRATVPGMSRRMASESELAALSGELGPHEQVLPAEEIARLADVGITGLDAYSWRDEDGWHTVFSAVSLRNNPNPAFLAHVRGHEATFHRFPHRGYDEDAHTADLRVGNRLRGPPPTVRGIVLVARRTVASIGAVRSWARRVHDLNLAPSTVLQRTRVGASVPSWRVFRAAKKWWSVAAPPTRIASIAALAGTVGLLRPMLHGWVAATGVSAATGLGWAGGVNREPAHERAGTPFSNDPWSDTDTTLMLRALPRLTESLRPAPEVAGLWVLDEATAAEALARMVSDGSLSAAEQARLTVLWGGLATFNWRDPDVPLAAGGMRVTTLAMWTEVERHRVEGRLSFVGATALWKGVDDRELDSHSPGELSGPADHAAMRWAPLRVARAAVPGLDPGDLHRGYLPELNPALGTPMRAAVWTSSAMVAQSTANAVRLAAAASRPTRALGREEFALWAGISEEILPPDLLGLLILDGWHDRLLQEVLGQKAAGEKNPKVPDGLVQTEIGGWWVIDAETHRVFDTAALEQRRSFYRFVVKDPPTTLRKPVVNGLDELGQIRADRTKAAMTLLSDGESTKPISNLAGTYPVSSRLIEGVAEGHSWLAHQKGIAWAVDPATNTAGITTAPTADGLVAQLDSTDPDRGPLFLRGIGSSRFGGQLATFLYGLRGINSHWAAPPGWSGPAYGEVVFGVLAHGWKYGRVGELRPVTEGVYLRHIDLDGPWSQPFPDGLEVAVEIDRFGRQWLINFYPGRAIDVSPNLRNATGSAVIVRNKDSSGSGVRVSRYAVATALHVVHESERFGPITVGITGGGSTTASGYVRIELDELSDPARVDLADQFAGTVDFALVIAPNLPDLFDPDEALSIAELAGQLDEAALLATVVHPDGIRRINVGPWIGGRARIPTSPGYSGGPLYWGELPAAIHIATDHKAGAVVLESPLFAELVEVGLVKAAQIGLLPGERSGGPTTVYFDPITVSEELSKAELLTQDLIMSDISGVTVEILEEAHRQLRKSWPSEQEWALTIASCARNLVTEADQDGTRFQSMGMLLLNTATYLVYWGRFTQSFSPSDRTKPVSLSAKVEALLTRRFAEALRFRLNESAAERIMPPSSSIKMVLARYENRDPSGFDQGRRGGAGAALLVGLWLTVTAVAIWLLHGVTDVGAVVAMAAVVPFGFPFQGTNGGFAIDPETGQPFEMVAGDEYTEADAVWIEDGYQSAGEIGQLDPRVTRGSPADAVRAALGSAKRAIASIPIQRLIAVAGVAATTVAAVQIHDWSVLGLSSAMTVAPIGGSPLGPRAELVALDDRVLVQLVNQQHQDASDAYAVLYQRHVASAYEKARGLTSNVAIQDDVVAEAVSTVYAALLKGAAPEHFRAYLNQSVRHAYLDHFRQVLQREAEFDDELVDTHPLLVDPARTEDDVPARLAAEPMAAIWQTLPERWRQVLALRVLQGLSAAEAAPLLGLGPNAGAALLYRAKAGLRTAFQAELDRAAARGGAEVIPAWVGITLAARATAWGAMLAAEDDPLSRRAADLRVDPADFTLIAHGSWAGVLVPTEDGFIPQTTPQLGDRLESLPQFRDWRATGAGHLTIPGRDLASNPLEMAALADRLGVTVLAPDTGVFVHAPDTTGGPARVSLADGGQWIEFAPGIAPINVVAPIALTNPNRAPNSIRFGPATVRSGAAPRAPPVRAGEQPTPDEQLTPVVPAELDASKFSAPAPTSPTPVPDQETKLEPANLVSARPTDTDEFASTDAASATPRSRPASVHGGITLGVFFDRIDAAGHPVNAKKLLSSLGLNDKERLPILVSWGLLEPTLRKATQLTEAGRALRRAVWNREAYTGHTQELLNQLADDVFTRWPSPGQLRRYENLVTDTLVALRLTEGGALSKGRFSGDAITSANMILRIHSGELRPPNDDELGLLPHRRHADLEILPEGIIAQIEPSGGREAVYLYTWLDPERADPRRLVSERLMREFITIIRVADLISPERGAQVRRDVQSWLADAAEHEFYYHPSESPTESKDHRADRLQKLRDIEQLRRDYRKDFAELARRWRSIETEFHLTQPNRPLRFSSVKPSGPTELVLRELLAAFMSNTVTSGLNISQATNLSSSAINNALRGLREAGWVASQNTGEEGRRHYRLTPRGALAMLGFDGSTHKRPNTARGATRRILEALLNSFDTDSEFNEQQILALHDVSLEEFQILMQRMEKSDWLLSRSERVDSVGDSHTPRIYYRLTERAAQQIRHTLTEKQDPLQDALDALKARRGSRSIGSLSPPHRVLRAIFLASHCKFEVHVRGIAGLTGLTERQVHEVLRSLELAGWVLSHWEGRKHYYHLTDQGSRGIHSGQDFGVPGGQNGAGEPTIKSVLKVVETMHSSTRELVRVLRSLGVDAAQSSELLSALVTIGILTIGPDTDPGTNPHYAVPEPIAEVIADVAGRAPTGNSRRWHLLGDINRLLESRLDTISDREIAQLALLLHRAAQ
jgi:RNA polymerase sigma factor (sigma-70 family)